MCCASPSRGTRGRRRGAGTAGARARVRRSPARGPRRHDAEDLVQETYARVLARPRFLRHDDDLGYLLKGLRNTFPTRIRTQKRKPPPLELDEARDGLQRASDPRHPEAALELTELLGAIAELPHDQRDVVVAIDIMGLTYREAGRALGAKEATITPRLHRGRARLAPSPNVFPPHPV